MSLAHSKLHRRNVSKLKRNTCSLLSGQRLPITLRFRSCSWDVFAYDLFPVQLRLSGSLLGQVSKSSPRPISAGQLHTLLCFHIQPINLVFFKGSYFLIGMRYFISGRASRLDAFSVYPFRTQLPGHALGRTTGTPLVRPLRSSRTRSSLPHVSYARDGYGPNCLTTF